MNQSGRLPTGKQPVGDDAGRDGAGIAAHSEQGNTSADVRQISACPGDQSRALRTANTAVGRSWRSAKHHTVRSRHVPTIARHDWKE
jgi:hypothetical protein